MLKFQLKLAVDGLKDVFLAPLAGRRRARSGSRSSG